MPSTDITFCADGAKCKKRNKCFRFTFKPDKEALVWYGNFLEQSKEEGRECDFFMEDKASTKQTIS